MRRCAGCLWAIARIGLALALIGGLVLAAGYWRYAGAVPDVTALASYRPQEKTVLYSADGQVLAEFYRENRQWVDLGDVAQSMRDATIAIEDRRFYEHNGIDLVGTARALLADVRARRIVEGGSTLTQQLARTLYLSQKRTLARKVREAILAYRIEQTLTKEQILELYLNQVYYGAGAYGVKAAAQVYFGKTPAELTLAESALLAGLPARPSRWSPFVNMGAARARRDEVLLRMRALQMITRRQAAAAMSRKVRLVPRRAARLKRAPYFVDWVTHKLLARLGPDAVYGGGLVVHTTLDLRLQRIAERAVRAGLVRGREFGSVRQAALVAIDPRTGGVKAMVGGRDYARSQFNRAVGRGRQPGSTFKPFVYLAGFDRGYTPESILDDSPLAVPVGTRTWTPGNDDDRFRGPVSIYDALLHSINLPAIRVGLDVGPEMVASYARMLGITSPLRAVPSLAIGTSEVTPLEMAAAYAAFANGGKRVVPEGITRVEDRAGQVIWEARPAPQQVIPQASAAVMSELLRDVVLYGTGRSASGVPNAAGKTGTTQEDRDAWFVGFTPELAAGVWAGNDDHSPMGGRVFGGRVPAPIWAEFMAQAAPIMAAAAGRRIDPNAIQSYRLEHPEVILPPPVPPPAGDGSAVPPGQGPAAGDGTTVPAGQAPPAGDGSAVPPGQGPAAGDGAAGGPDQVLPHEGAGRGQAPAGGDGGDGGRDGPTPQGEMPSARADHGRSPAARPAAPADSGSREPVAPNAASPDLESSQGDEPQPASEHRRHGPADNRARGRDGPAARRPAPRTPPRAERRPARPTPPRADEYTGGRREDAPKRPADGHPQPGDEDADAGRDTGDAGDGRGPADAAGRRGQHSPGADDWTTDARE